MKKRVFVEVDGKGKILINPKEQDYINYPHIVEPDLDRVRGISPELCYISGNIVASKRSPAPLCPQPTETAAVTGNSYKMVFITTFLWLSALTVAHFIKLH